MYNNKKQHLKKILIWGAVIVLIQAAFLIRARSKAVGSVKDFNQAIDEKLASQNIDDRTKLIIKTDLALANYRMINQKFPDKLDDLVPRFLKKIPIDPATGVAFSYSIDGDIYTLARDKEAAIALKNKSSEDAEGELISSLDVDINRGFVYSSKGKKDPFKSFEFVPKAKKLGATPLEQVDYPEIKLAGTILGMDEPKALVEVNGKAFYISIGTKVGLNNGEVVKIENNKITVLESSKDFTGAKDTRLIEITSKKN